MDNSPSLSSQKTDSKDVSLTSPKSTNISNISQNLSDQENSEKIKLLSIDYTSFYKYFNRTLDNVISSKGEVFPDDFLGKEIKQDYNIDIEKANQTIKCRICHNSKNNVKTNQIIDCCDCEGNYKYAHEMCLKKNLERRILEEVCRNLSALDSKSHIEQNLIQDSCLKCEKCNYEYKVRNETKHSFKQLRRFYKNKSRLSFIRDISILLWIVLMVMTNLICLLISSIIWETASYSCFLSFSSMFLLSGLTFCLINFYEKMEETNWCFGKNEEFLPLRDYMIYVDKKISKDVL